VTTMRLGVVVDSADAGTGFGVGLILVVCTVSVTRN